MRTENSGGPPAAAEDFSDLALAASGAPTQAPDPLAGWTRHAFSFSGSGREYFRIWIVNLLLTVATLGIYSAWAKVRRLQYFDRNTALAGAVFDFRGPPLAILRGRLLAVLLLTGYHYAFGFSKVFGVVVITALVLLLPLLFRSALQFRTRHSRWRGLAFGFDGSLIDAYAAYGEPILLFLLPSTLAALGAPITLVLAVSCVYLLWPLLHGAARLYQQRNLRYGNLTTEIDVPARRFYRYYLVAAGWSLLAALGFGVLTNLILIGLHTSLKLSTDLQMMLSVGVGMLSAYFAYLVALPYLAARISNLMWSETQLPGVRFAVQIPARGYIWLQLRNAVLTLLSLGLYRPFAVVQAHVYRLRHAQVLCEGDLASILAARAHAAPQAAGDATADLFGVDFSW
ncbi:YjgN family protein [Massilia sp. TS11]|uniref:YjgN family protein n=1 Tax=Massilia sp. TS11 TaxID=2908003 RepID=UPI001EDB9DFC|nr:YjgN family protein [Massilia sp. TS11]MCG2582945.1 DUF898 domain-containing protein [Massilia sp. TS11]